MHYRPDDKALFNEDNLVSIANQIKMDSDRFNPIIQHYLEDRSWILNTEDTLNFSVPKNKVILSNTINTHDQENTTIITHMDMLINYIKRHYKVPALKYVIVEDNKYYFTWILILIGYYPNKKETINTNDIGMKMNQNISPSVPRKVVLHTTAQNETVLDKSNKNINSAPTQNTNDTHHKHKKLNI
jgi:hypothetical protein